MFEESAPVIIDSLIENSGELTIKELSEITDLEQPIINRTIRILKQINVIKSSGSKITLIQNIKANDIVTASQLGLDLESFGKFFNIEKHEKELALEIASSVEKVKKLDIKSRNQLIQSRPFIHLKKTDEITQILLSLYESSNHALVEHLKKLSTKDKILKSLLEIHLSSEKSLVNYVKESN